MRRRSRRSVSGDPTTRTVGFAQVQKVVEVPSPQAKPWLVRLEAFQIGVRPGPQRWTVRDEILSVLGELVGADGILTQRDVVAWLNPSGDERRRWAIGRALWRMAHRRREGDPVLEAVGRGRYRVSGSRHGR